MTKYLVNENIHGYEKITCEDLDKTNNSGNLFVIIIDKSCDGDVNKYYKLINSALRNNNRVILISINDENKIFKTLASLMTTFYSYDIYQVEEKESISAPYLLKLEERHPDITEVQTYISGDVTSYSDITTILFGIESLVDEGNIDALKSFIEEHITSIENLTTAINNMKKTCDIFNSNELIDAVNDLKEREHKLNKTIEEKDKTLEEIKYDRDSNKVEVENLKRENEKLKNKNNDLKAQNESGSAVIKSYKEINTQLIQCKTKLILYFKEISYVRYMNSLVNVIMNILETRKLKSKLLIYDSHSEMYASYKPLQVITGADYVSAKGNLISKTQRFIVAEPNPTILQDILTSEQCFDVVIVYDRMHSLTDIVAGNNVTKLFVMNSSKEYKELQGALKITDTSHIITQSTNSLNKANIKDNEPSQKRQFLDIPMIENYNANTDSGKISKYMKLVTQFKKVLLVDTIIKMARIDTLYK